ncbi:MAG: SpoIIE family protein phosphatase [Syntrophobacteraceae bacterium]|nr:SpoIIE family protein phosphatase [Syntrophobacteraceae bacterium]
METENNTHSESDFTCQSGASGGCAAVEKMRARLESLKECFRISGLINSSLQLDQVLENIMTTSRSILKADACSLMLVDERSGELVFEVAQGPVADKLKGGMRISRGQGIAGSVFETGESLLIENAYQDNRFNREFDRRTGYRTRSILCVPLKIKEKVIGVSQVINKLDGSDFNEEDRETLSLLCANAAVAVENARLHQRILRNQQIERDLEIAKSVQSSFLPAAMPALDGFGFSALYQPAREIGGDFYDFVPLGEDRLGILIGDVSGKGVPAALFMARFTTDFHLLALREKDPEKLMHRINEGVCERSCRGMFVTLLYMVLQKNSGEAFYINAGHLPPIVWNSTTEKFDILSGGGGPPLGIVPDQHYTSEKMSLAPGSCVLLYTDGLMEAKNGCGEFPGLGGIEKWFRAGSSRAESSLSRLSLSLSRFVGDCPQSDDVTLVLAEYRESKSSAA